MSGFLRPEAKAAIARWWGVGLGVAVAAFGLRWGFLAFGFVQWLGWVIAALGVIAAWAAFQKARFGGGGGGAGVVTVREGEISYYGPYSGGVAELSDLALITLDKSRTPAVWRLDSPGKMPLFIPENAEGAGQLFDVFVTLPGLSVERMLAAKGAGGPQAVVIWQRPSNRLH